MVTRNSCSLLKYRMDISHENKEVESMQLAQIDIHQGNTYWKTADDNISTMSQGFKHFIKSSIFSVLFVF